LTEESSEDTYHTSDIVCSTIATINVTGTDLERCQLSVITQPPTAYQILRLSYEKLVQ